MRQVNIILLVINIFALPRTINILFLGFSFAQCTSFEEFNNHDFIVEANELIN